MTKEQKDMLRILDETVAFYGEDPSRRATSEKDSTRCVYHTDDGRMCAVGRLLTPEEHQFIDERGINSDCGASSLCNNFGEFFPSLEHPRIFYVDLQSLHDFPEHWEVKGLSEDGQSLYKEIKSRILEGYYDGTI